MAKKEAEDKIPKKAYGVYSSYAEVSPQDGKNGNIRGADQKFGEDDLLYTLETPSAIVLGRLKRNT